MNQICVVVFIRDVSLIWKNLNFCLWNEAELWWNNQLDEVTQLGLIAYLNRVEKWCKTLEKHFCSLSSEVWTKLNNTCYTVNDVWNCHSSTEYVNIIIAATKKCDQSDSKFRNVMQVWMHIDLSLQKVIDKFSLNTTIEQFMNILQSKQLNWYDEFSQHHSVNCDWQNQQPDRNCFFSNLLFLNQTFVSKFSIYSYWQSYFDNHEPNRPAFSYTLYVSYDRSSYGDQYNYEQSNNCQQNYQNCSNAAEDYAVKSLAHNNLFK